MVSGRFLGSGMTINASETAVSHKGLQTNNKRKNSFIEVAERKQN